MPNLLPPMLIAIGLLAFVVAAMWFSAIALLLRMRFGPAQSEPIPREAIPAPLRPILEGAAPLITALGFEYAGSRLVRPNLRGPQGGPTYTDCYRHPHYRCFACIHPAEMPEPGAAAAVTFVTGYADGHALITLNRRQHLYLPQPPSQQLADHYLPDIAAQWALHRQRMADHPGEPLDRSPWEDEAARQAGIIDFWVGSALMRPAGAGLQRVTLRGAFSQLRRQQAGNRRLARLPPASDRYPQEARVAADLLAARALEAVQGQGALDGRGKTLLFVMSALLGYAAFASLMPWELVPIFFGLLLFHEFGHALAMRATGYRNLQVLVLPFMGAVAVGRKDDAGPWTRLLVLLAGPAPGLLVAVACLWAGVDQGRTLDPLLMKIGVIALLLNLFNLLPLTPLDGGQIVEEFLFARWPRLRLAFTYASIAGLLALGIYLDSWALTAIALFLLFGARDRLAASRLARAVGTRKRHAAVPALFQALHEAATIPHPFTRRLQRVRGALPQVTARVPRLNESLLGMAIYCAVIVLPLLAIDPRMPVRPLLTAAFSPPEAPPSDQALETVLAAAKGPQERWQLLVGAAEEAEEDFELQSAHRLYQRALEETAQLPAGDLRRLDTRIALARTGAEPLAQWRALLPELTALTGADRLRLAVALEEIQRLEGGNGIAGLREAIRIREQYDEERGQIGADRQEIARLLYRNGDAAGAEAELRGAIADDPSALGHLGLLLVDRGRAEEAETLLAQAQAGPPARRLSPLEREARVWALLSRGQRDEAGAQLKEQLALLPERTYWLRLPLLLDLLHSGIGEADERARWVAQLRAQLAGTHRRAVERMVQRWAEYPWRATQVAARKAVLAELGEAAPFSAR